ncbi:hypothetical protein A3709_08065 [Halioglobus sp. HI00S01]|uniref:glycoside hydrolase family 20 protein n=1 Tax=Halioglobus sp. HI00S01 TaxID=1822214 RepID=UPI0007C340DC|nr:family 20 glycosylhydrolase [Halioglobus sp. HI00S01]KZX54955.1 hypothetical protein A3709_08065 [Halioglobus sp. HI00S01]
MQPAILPFPQSLQRDEGSCDLSAVTVNCDSSQLAASAELLQATLSTAESGTPLTLSLAPDIETPEGYRLSVAHAGVTLEAGTPAGAFYGCQSLLQLVATADSHKIPCLRIDDAPTYAWRGMHLDCSRHFFDVAFIKRYIDLLALHKMNRFHWHLCDDQGWRLESRRFPRLTQVGAWRDRSVIGHTANRERRYEDKLHGGYYTQEEVKEVVAYAAARHIEVLPEIDIPGHAAALLAAYPQLACDDGDYQVEAHYGIFPDVLCPSEETFAFLADLFAELAELFPFEYVHIGGDEVIKDKWQQCPRCQQLMRDQGMTSVDRLHGYFVSRVEDILASLGRRAIAWNEVMEGNVDTSTTIMCWTGFDACQQALEAGHETIMTPVECTYFDFYQSTSLDEPQAIHGLASLKQVFDYDPLPDGVSEALRPRILGAQANVWTEYLRDTATVEYACLPRMTALSEVTWTGPGRDWTSFCQRLPALMDTLRQQGHTVADSAWKPRLEFTPATNGGLSVTMACDMPGTVIHYTTDGSPPTTESPIYRAPLVIQQSCVVRCMSVDSVTGRCYGDERQHLSIHRALHCPLFRLASGELHEAPELARLTDGKLGNERIFHGFEWTQFTDVDNDLVIDLGSSQPVTRMSLNFEAGAHRELFFPSRIEAYSSDDSQQWQPLGQCEGDALNNGAVILEADTTSARYLRLRLENLDQHYGPEQRQLITRPVHLDEIVVD